MRKILRNSVMGAMMSSLMIFASCETKESSVLDTIPADAVVVYTFDTEKLALEAGCDVNNGKITLSEDLKKCIKDSDDIEKFDKVAELMSCVGQSEIVCYVKKTNEVVLTFGVTDGELFKQEVETILPDDGIDWAEQDGFSVYSLSKTAVDRITLVVKEGQGWIVAKSGTPIAFLKGELAEAENKSIADVAWKAEALKKGSLFNSVTTIGEQVLAQVLPEMKLSEVSICSSTSLEGENYTQETRIYTADGEVVQFAAALADIDASFLKYLNKDDIAVLAFGIDKDTDWKAVVDFLGKFIGRDQRAMLDVAMPYLQTLDGTVAVAGGTSADAETIKKMDYSAWHFTAVVSLAEGKSEEFKGQIKNYALAAGLPVEETAEGLKCAVGEYAFYLNSEESKLILSNRAINHDGGSMFAEADFAGKKIAMIADVPYGSELMKSLGVPFGVNLKTLSVADECKFTAHLNGAQGGMLKAIIAEIAKEFEKKQN